MKKSKRLLSLLLALTMAFSLVGNAAVAAWADDVPQSPETVVSDNGENNPSDPDKDTNPTDNGGTGDADADKDTTDDANSGGDTKDEPEQQEDGDANGDETPAETETVAVPTRKAGYPAETSATVQTGTAYLLEDLQAGKIFEAAEGQSRLTYKNYYYQRSTDGGETWGPMTDFSEAIFGMTTIQITELTAGTYVYRFYASHDGVNFSEDTWTLTLTVEDAPTLEFSFYVGRDYNYNTTQRYPIIKLYNVDKDADGNEVLGDEIENVFLYSNFTSTPAEGEEEYDVAQGKLVSNYQMFYAKLEAGRYAYRAFGWNTETEAYDVALGGMTLNLPTDKNVDGGAGGGGAVYLQCNSFYVSTKKTDNTYFAEDEYHVRVDCPIMGCSTAMGDPYVKGSYTYYPTMLYAAGNACLYNLYAYPDIEGYIFTQTINQTYRASYTAGTKSLTINTGITLDVTVPSDATFGLYFQWNNFNTTEVAPVCADEDMPYADRWTDNGDGTKTAQYFISKGNGNYTWRLSDDTHVTQAGWLASQSKDGELTFSFAEDAATNRVSHDFSKLGSTVTNRDEADLQVNLDPSGFEAITGTTRVRAYRHWQLINSDAGNIMVEPDFHWNVLRGDADYEPVNGGNTTANWADITPGTQDSIITVYYDSVDVDPSSHGSHGGLFPATNPERVGVIVVGGTGVQHGTADAKVKFNMASGATTTRSMDWDYNYDTWSYGANETNPTLDFTVTSTGSANVEYAFVTTDNSMTTKITDFTSVSPDGSGKYVVPLAAFNKSGNGMGGTVIIRMTDETGVSYRLVRVAKVTITTENVSNPGENIMPGDQVKLSFKGMYRSVNKISGIFNPTNFKPTYYAGDTKFEGTLGQYQKMDNATVTVTIPEDVTFADGAATTEYTFTNGYTFGSMYSAANPFAFLYNMTDAGVGTNFNAVTVTYYMNHYADAVVTVYQKATYTVKLNITDDSGNAVEGVTVTLLGRDGKTPIAANEDGTYTLGYGPYTYTLSKNGYVLTRGSFTLGGADAANVKDDVLTVKTAVMPVAGENAWDGATTTEPAKDADGAYLIGTAAELAWFAANGSNASAVLTADIDLAGYDWTPLDKFYGTFDGADHMVKNLYINSTSYPVGLFGYVKTGAKVTNLGVSGNVTTTNASYGQAGGIVGYLEENASIENCYSSVNVTAGKHGGGIAGYTASGAAITNCYASGDITTTSANECYLGGICGTYFSEKNGATLTNCYSAATVTGSNGTTSYLGGLTPSTNTANYVDNCFYLENTVTKESPKYGITGLGTAKTAAEMKAAVEANDHPFKAQMLADMKSWDGVTTTEPAKDADGAYMIGTAAELAWFAQAVNEGQYTLNAVLTADIDLENEAWTPIGNNTAATTTGDVMYKGVFNGQGHVVKNLYINNTDSKQGLFSYVSGTIKNLGVTGSITTTGKFVGGIVGYLSGGKVENCYSDVTVSAAQNAGGIVGGAHNGTTISYCYNAGDVTVSVGRVGGIVSCAAAGPVIGSAKLDNCYNIGSVSGKSFVGGVACVSQTSSYGANVYYLDTCITANNYGKGTAKTEAELLTLLGAVDGDTLQTALFNKWAGQVAAADEAAVKAVIDAIDAIPQPVSLSNNSKTKIIAAEKLYNALTAAQKEKVTNADILRAARAELDRLEAEQAAADKAAADAVIDKINAIGEVTLEKETAIKEARAAYDALTTVQKNLVKNDGALTTLEAAEATLKQLKADKEQADAVIGWINNLNDPITLAEEQGVRNIRERYDSLTDAQKALVTNLDKLEKAEKQLTELKAAIADTESKINAIGTVELTDACKAKIDAARDAYDALNKEQQAKVSNYATLTAAETEYQRLLDKDTADKAAAKSVDDLIDTIGKVELTDDCKAKIDAARKAYGKLTDDQKVFVSKLDILTAAETEYQRLLDKDIADKAAAKNVNDLIDAIGTVELTDACKAKIDAARKAYDALTNDQKALVSNYGTLTAAETQYEKLAADRAAADAVIAKIDAIGTVELTDACKAKIDAAREAYDALTNDQKALVSNLETLTAAEAQYEKLAADKAAADAVIAKIDTIGTVELTDACKAKIDAAREAYNALTDEQKELVSNLKTLTDAEAAYKELTDKAAADAVIAKIDTIGTVELTDDCKAKIDAAREAYDALTDEQKELVSNLKTLTDAEDEYKNLADKAAADKAAADAVIDKINAIGDVTKDSGDAIKDARDAYDKLTDDQKELVPDEILKKLTDAESTYKDLIAPRPRPSDKTNTKTDGKDVKSQNTGDNSHVTLWLGGVVLSAAALILLAKKRRQDA